MKGHLFLKLVVLAIVSFVLAKICYHYSGDFLAEAMPKNILNDTKQEIQVSMVQSFYFSHVDAVAIENNNANIVINRTNDPNGKVEIKSTSTNTALKTLQENNFLTIKFPGDSDYTGGPIILSIPSTVKSIIIRSKSGTVVLNNLVLNQLSLNTLSGNLKLTNVSADNAEIHSVSGDIDWQGTVKTLSAKTVSGKISIDSAFNHPSYDIITVSGKVNIVTAQPLNAVLSLKSVSGKVTTNPITIIKSNDKQVTGLIQVRSVSGDVTINGTK